MSSLKVISNVARDILQSASVFKTLPTVVWEYVSNSLQYVDQNVTPKVVVKLEASKKRATISDNARGMAIDGLQNYFTMHGHNQDRLSGRPGRGLFGTGKSAAFGVADRLTIRTVRDGLLNEVTLTRDDIEREASKGNVTEVPIRHVQKNVQTVAPTGTEIIIEGITCRFDVPGVMAFIQRHLGRGFRDAEVIVNGHEVEYDEPNATDTYAFNATGEFREKLGDVTLNIKVSSAPLEQDRRGIDITSNGVLLETTLGSSEGKDLAQYIFGDLEIPRLINETSGPNPAFNLTRDMRLNLENEVARTAHAFISVNVEQVRSRLVEADRKRRQTEEAKRLQRQADEIAKLINADFAEYADKLERINATVSSVGMDRSREKELNKGKGLKAFVFGDEEAADVVSPDGAPGGEPVGNEGHHGSGERAQNPVVAPNPDGDRVGKNIDAATSKKNAHGGFHVEYQPLGIEENRASYVRDTRTIIINLDFPQIQEAVNRDGVESITFKRLSNEVAITEYAIALGNELVNARAFGDDSSDYIVEIRQTINRINRRAVSLTA